MTLEEQISSVLNDPEAMSKISSIASALGAGTPPAAAPQEPSPPPAAGGLRLPDVSGDNRARLLMALKPFLSKKRAPYVDSAVAILRLAQVGALGGALSSLLPGGSGE